MPSVSVLLPAWNAEATIGRALASVLDESGVDLECVVVDDASTDGTLEVVRGIAAMDSRVVVLALEENGGVSNARNRGLELVRGEWLTLLDADDRFLPGGLDALHRAATDRDALAVVGQQVWSDGRRTWLADMYDIPDIRLAGRTSLVRRPGLVYFVSLHAKLFHRSTWAGLTFEGRVLGDQPWVIRALLRAGERIEVVAETVYEWRRPAAGEAGSITTTSRASAHGGVARAVALEHALRNVLEELERELPDPLARQVVAARYVERLLRSDLGVHLSMVLARRDPTTDELVAAVERFVGGVPNDLLTASSALATDILEPPLRHWNRLPGATRLAYWSLLDAALRADPDVPNRATTALSRATLRLVARRRPGRALMVLASILLMLAGTPSLGRRAIRRLRS